MRLFVMSVVSAIAFLLTACGGETTSHGVICPLAIVGIDLVYPAPGSTGIPDDVKQIVVSRPTSKLTLQPSTGFPLVTTSPAPVPSPLPSPNAQRAGTNFDSAFAVPALSAATTYSVTAQDLGPCGSPPLQMGSFTTQ